MWVLNIFGQMVSSPRMDWTGWFSQWQVAPQNLQPEHQVAVLMLSLSFGNISLQKSPKSWKLFPTCTSFVPKQPKSQSWASRGKGGEPESTMNRLRIWAGQGRGDLLVVEPPVAAVSEEVGFAVFPLEGCVHVTRQTSPPFLDVLQRFHNSW